MIIILYGKKFNINPSLNYPLLTFMPQLEKIKPANKNQEFVGRFFFGAF